MIFAGGFIQYDEGHKPENFGSCGCYYGFLTEILEANILLTSSQGTVSWPPRRVKRGSLFPILY